MCFGTEIRCPVCGSKVVQSGKGRTKEYCSDNCRDFNKFLSAAENALLKIDHIDKDQKRFIRSKFFSMANLLNNK